MLTNAELDTLWFQAQHDAIKAGEDFTRYRFAALVAAAEREACAMECDKIERRKWETVVNGGAMQGIGARDCAAAIRARNNT